MGAPSVHCALTAGALLLCAGCVAPAQPRTPAAATPTARATPLPAAATIPAATAALREATPTRVASPTPAPPRDTIVLTKLVDGLTRPLLATQIPSEPSRMYVVEQPGRIRVVESGLLREQLFIDITDRVGSRGNEQGLLGLAFSPAYATDRAFFVNYTGPDGNSRVSRFTADPASGVADPASEQLVLRVDQPFPNHNGGNIVFGPDGMLWLGFGDGGSQGDPANNGQNPGVLLGKLLRIDPLGGAPYRIPPDNPKFPAGRPEVWAIGLRNPWRFSFDRATGDLYIGDVGQNTYEEIDFASRASKGGENYGWRLREGFEPYKDGSDQPSLTSPIYAYDHSFGCSVTGGFVYRGTRIPALSGAFVYADYCSGRLWSLRRGSDGRWTNALLAATGLPISAFGEQNDGELLVVALSGTVYRMEGSR